MSEEDRDPRDVCDEEPIEEPVEEYGTDEPALDTPPPPEVENQNPGFTSDE